MNDTAPTRLGQRAVVIGASMSGLLAARVLSERFAEVVLLERDDLPTGAATRKGTPHAVMPHGLLARGREVLEALFPGFTEALVAQGATLGDLQSMVAFDASRRRFDATPCGRNGVAVSRLCIEAELRRRVLALPGVRVITGVDVVAPVCHPGGDRIVGVRYVELQGEHADQAAGHTLEADLTLDCSGRGSRSMTWLRSWGFEPPVEDRVEVGIVYASAYFAREGPMALGAGLDKAAVIHTATPDLPRPGVLLAQEPDAEGRARWVLGLGGYAGDHPEATLQGLRQRASQMGSPEFARLTQDGQCIGKVLRYAFPYSLRRHYEQLRRFPGGYVVMGDALTSFNPIYGQGMTVAACEALALQQALQPGLEGLSRRFFRAASRVIDTPWQLAVGADLAIDHVPGPRPLPVRLVNRWITRVFRAAATDAVVARRFLEVMHLLKPPTALFAPGVVWRVLRHRGPAAGGRAAAEGSRVGLAR